MDRHRPACIVRGALSARIYHGVVPAPEEPVPGSVVPPPVPVPLPPMPEPPVAVPAWAAFGGYDWNSLMTRRDRVYERGLWDVENTNPDGSPRATLVVAVARAFAHGDEPPALAPGWWQSGRRLSYPPVAGWELAQNGSAETFMKDSFFPQTQFAV